MRTTLTATLALLILPASVLADPPSCCCRQEGGHSTVTNQYGATDSQRTDGMGMQGMGMGGMQRGMGMGGMRGMGMGGMQRGMGMGGMRGMGMGGMQGMGMDGMQGMGMGMDGMQGMGMQRGMSADEHGPIFELLSRHDAIHRTVKEIPGGVRTTTTTSDPELVATLRTHVRQMDRRLEKGQPVRMWDPVFRDVFAHADEIDLVRKDVDGGIEVTETSENPEVVPMIRAHATKLNAFVEDGHAAARPPWAGGGRGRGGMRRGR